MYLFLVGTHFFVFINILWPNGYELLKSIFKNQFNLQFYGPTDF